MRTNTTRTARTTQPADQFLDGMADDETLDEDIPADVDTDTPGEFATDQEFEKGTWEFKTREASRLYKRAEGANKRASTMLWDGAKEAIEDWSAKSEDDVNAEALSHRLLVIMGTSRKGDVSKIKKVAVAVRTKGLATENFPNLSKAYAEARRLLDTTVEEQTEDTAADGAVQAVAADAPKTASSIESAVALAISLAGGADEFARVVFDTINHGGGENHEAHRSFVRAFAEEAAGRVRKVADAEKARKAAEREQAKADAAATVEANKAERATKAEAPAKGKAKAKPVESKSKGNPNEKALPPKQTADSGESSDLDALADEAPAPSPAKKAAAKPKPRPARQV